MTRLRISAMEFRFRAPFLVVLGGCGKEASDYDPPRPLFSIRRIVLFLPRVTYTIIIPRSHVAFPTGVSAHDTQRHSQSIL